ncbi:hypothetical protein NE237_031650 [Protea cynaroides]|uniref:Uncharacterized protein n=1 Tax=Protea cynaroides TaxID=273540 RepID=A0A9Q0L1J5_9MAGN|nr:hypothetical protein NE237_031650 [Protea cynaroides]
MKLVQQLQQLDSDMFVRLINGNRKRGKGEFGFSGRNRRNCSGKNPVELGILKLQEEFRTWKPSTKQSEGGRKPRGTYHGPGMVGGHGPNECDAFKRQRFQDSHSPLPHCLHLSTLDASFFFFVTRTMDFKL